MYWEVWTPSVWNILEKLDSEKMDILEKLGYERLALSLIHILIVDEALSVGDKTFQSKCITKIREIMAGGKVTFLFVTHSTAAAKEFCRRGIVLDKGKIILDGEIEESIGFYERQK